MKISEFIESLGLKYETYLKFVKKGIFWIALNKEAFWISKKFNMKITKLDKNSIKVGFPDGVRQKWQNIFIEKNISIIFFIKDKNGEYKEEFIYKGDAYYKNFRINLEDYKLTKDRILGLAKIGLEDFNKKNFLLKDKLENIYFLLINLLMKLPKKERFFLREKIERNFLNLLEFVYDYMYNIYDREELIKKIFTKILTLRELTRLLYRMGKIKNDNVYLDLGDRWLEVLKIVKGIKSKYG